jgi:hypothetical protein
MEGNVANDVTATNQKDRPQKGFDLRRATSEADDMRR